MPAVSGKALGAVMDAIWCASEDLDVPGLVLVVACAAPDQQPLPLIAALTFADDFRSGLTLGDISPFDALRRGLVTQGWVSSELIERWRALALWQMSRLLGVLEAGQHEFLLRYFGARPGMTWHLAAVRTVPAPVWPRALHAASELLGLDWGYPHGGAAATPAHRARVRGVGGRLRDVLGARCVSWMAPIWSGVFSSLAG